MQTAIKDTIVFPISAVGSDASAAADVFEWTTDEAFSILSVSIQCDSDNPPTGSAAQIDVNKNGTTIFSTNPTIDAGESHSDTAATAPVLSTTPTAVADGDKLEFDIDQVGSTNPGQEYKVTLHILRPIVGP